MSKKYHGVIPPIITPVDENEKVDEKGFRDLVEYCIKGGLHGLFVAGTNGETMSLTQTERNRAIEIVLDQVGGRIPVMAGVMDSSTSRVVENIRALKAMGGTCAVVTPVFYDRHTSEMETVRHFAGILEKTDIDLMIYNIPPFVGTGIKADTVIKIADLDDRVVGYKDSSGAYTDLLRLIDHFDGTQFSVMEGITPHAMSAILMGADGFVPALAPAFPEMFAAAYDAAASGNIAGAKKYNQLIRKSSSILSMSVNGTAAAKYAISLLGYTDKRVMMPQDPILPEEEEKIRICFDEVNKMFEELKK